LAEGKTYSNWPSAGTTLAPGDYYFRAATLSNNYSLRVSGSGTVRIFVDGSLTLGGTNIRLNATGSSAQLVLAVKGNLTSSGSSASTINGLFYATGSI